MTVLLDYQAEDVRGVSARDGRALLAHEPGLGKTMMWLSWLVGAGAYSAVVVCPASLKYHWRREAWEHYRIKAVVLSGQKNRRVKGLYDSAKLYVVNYDILSFWIKWLKRKGYRSVCVDECHMIGNMATKRCQAVRALCHGVEYVCGLSGTPLTNRPIELYPMLNILMPRKFSSPFSFGHRFCDARKEFGSWTFKGARNLPALHKLLTSTVMIRRTKEEVLPELPAKIRTVLPLDIEDRKQYDRAENDLVGWLMEQGKVVEANRAMHSQRYSWFTYCKFLAAKLKLKYAMQWLRDFLASTDEKILVGTIHRSITKGVYEGAGVKAVYIDGSRTAKQRQAAVDTFRHDPECRLMVGQIKAAGVGLNLPEATTAAVFELPWSPGLVQQFFDRCHRLTSLLPVNTFVLPAVGTIEELICEILQRKARVLSQVLDGGEDVGTDLDIYDELQKEILKRRRKG